jgi:tetratricopeptide (TPR) repeat protein
MSNLTRAHPTLGRGLLGVPSERSQGVVLFALALLIYGFGIGRGFVFDDIIYISENPLLRRGDAFRVFWFSSEAFNYYPIFWSLLRLQWLLWGDHPLGYHLVTLLLHCSNAVLIWRVAKGLGAPGAWWVGALFAVHPVNVQTVAWAAEQKNTWSFFFLTLAFLAFVRHTETRRWPAYALSLLWFVIGLGCKTSIVCLPVFLAVYYAFRGGNLRRRLLLRLIPFFVTAAAAGITTMWFEQNRAGAQSLLGTLSLWQRLEASGAAFWFYAGKALLPIHLTPMYRGWVDTTAADHTALPGFLLLITLLLCALFWRQIGAAVACGLAYYALMLLPLLGIFDTTYFAYSQIADHWQYHALPGLLVAVVAVVSRVAQRTSTPVMKANLAGAVATACFATLAATHFAHFENARTLWTYVTEQNPNAWLAWYNLGNEQAAKGEYAEAITDYRAALHVKPNDYRARFNLANTLAAANQMEEADRAYIAAQEARPDDPDGFVNRGVLLLRMTREDEAVAQFIHALQLDPHKISAQVNLISVNLRRGHVEEAETCLQEAAVGNDANSHRIAQAIKASSDQNIVSRSVLRRFAERACALSGGQRDLVAVLATL